MGGRPGLVVLGSGSRASLRRAIETVKSTSIPRMSCLRGSTGHDEARGVKHSILRPRQFTYTTRQSSAILPVSSIFGDFLFRKKNRLGRGSAVPEEKGPAPISNFSRTAMNIADKNWIEEQLERVRCARTTSGFRFPRDGRSELTGWGGAAGAAPFRRLRQDGACFPTEW